MIKRFFVRDSRYADDLIKLDFPAELYTSPKDCETYLKHCNQYNMKWLTGSYGSIVHKEFGRYFNYIPIRNDEQYEIQQKITCKKGLDDDYSIDGVNLELDHVNLFQSKLYDEVYLVTSSPYGSLNMYVINNLKKYPYGSYVIHPNLLDYHGFIGRFDERLRHPLWDLNYVYTNASSEQMIEISEQIANDIDGVFPPFLRLGGE